MNAIKIYRVANALHRRNIPVLPKLLKLVIFLLYNSMIPPECEIGKGSYFGHRGIGVVLHPRTKVGERVLLGQGITLGGSLGEGPPTIGDDVWIGPGARILGNITVGRNSIIGANAVVTRDVPENSIVGGVPAKLLRTIAPGQLDTSTGTLRDIEGAGSSGSIN
jgi:serine O-acetyltransferase